MLFGALVERRIDRMRVVGANMSAAYWSLANSAVTLARVHEYVRRQTSSSRADVRRRIAVGRLRRDRPFKRLVPALPTVAEAIVAPHQRGTP